MIGRRISFFNEIESTNDYVKNYHQEFADGDILVAQMQTSGRGRRDHKWISPRGNLYASFYLLEQHFKSPFEVIQLFSNALITLLSMYNIAALIKYPNDILVQRKKIAGILIEHTNNAYIVGIGLNVIKLSQSNYPFVATSLEEESGLNVDYRDVLQALIDVLNNQLESKEKWYKSYLSHSYVIGKTIKYHDQEYRIVAINRDGELELKNKEEVISLPMNEVSLEDVYHE